MSDETMTADDLWEQYRSNEEDAKKAEAEDLIPTGTYEGQGVDYTLSVGDREGGLYYGKPMARLRTELYDVQGRTRPLFFNVSPVVVEQADGRTASPSKLFLQIAKATGTVGKQAKETLEAWKITRLKYRVRANPGGVAKDGSGRVFEPGNFVDAVKGF